MIDFNTQIKIQAFLDGELPESEALEIASLVARDREAAALHAELKTTRGILATAEEGILLPETREFYWSKIRREIEQTAQQRAPAIQRSLWHSVSAWLKPLGAVAAVAVVSILAWQQMDGGNGSGAIVTAQFDSDAITFQDDSSGTTFVWFNYPAEKRVANETGLNTLN